MVPPVLLFGYRRPIHLARSWKALAGNQEAKNTELHVFLDGPKGNEDASAVLETREEAKRITGFKNIDYYFAEKNKGLSRSILDGINLISKKECSWIVLEDDLVVGKHFLNYMHEAIAVYKNHPAVASIHGYVYPTDHALPTTFFLKGADCWGWATWRSAWNKFEPDGRKLLEQLKRRNLEKEFDFGGAASFTAMLKDQIEGKNDSWAVRWHASAFMASLFTLYPGKSLVHNIGLDATGTHCEPSTQYQTQLCQQRIAVQAQPVVESPEGRTAFVSFFRGLSNKKKRKWFSSIFSKSVNHALV